LPEASYEEIARQGGGISNRNKLRAATSEALKKRAHAALKNSAYGTTR